MQRAVMLSPSLIDTSLRLGSHHISFHSFSVSHTVRFLAVLRVEDHSNGFEQNSSSSGFSKDEAGSTVDSSSNDPASDAHDRRARIAAVHERLSVSLRCVL